MSLKTAKYFRNLNVLYPNISFKKFLLLKEDEMGNNILNFLNETIYEVDFHYNGEKIFEGGYKRGKPFGLHRKWTETGFLHEISIDRGRISAEKLELLQHLHNSF